MIFQDDVLVYGTTKEQFDSRMLAVKSQLHEKNFTINEKNLTQNQSIALGFWDVEKIKKNAKASTNNKQLESFVGLANFYGS